MTTLRDSLNTLASRHNLCAIVVSDAEGLLIDANEACADAEPIAALGTLVEAGMLSARREDRAPTVTRRYSMDDFDVLVSAVGDFDDCQAAVAEAAPALRVLSA